MMNMNEQDQETKTLETMYLTAENAVKPVSSNDDPSFRLSTSQKAPTESK